ncbi:hypothetical protein KP509_30G014900 [Ceratopteris richardii]|uniref:At4g15545-like C-terminal domain-containing protein n=1 Tax=Ceratopteris richardii TaxID=49495 RepID=A0A8T2R1W3_CERRI|nr:hypothetical protein KP509_30G014900 [Ceratopteris richardii]
MIILPNMVHGSESALSPAIMAVLPKDPYEQLDVARRITSLAVSSRVDLLEAEIDKLRQKVADRDMTISTLQGRVNELEHETQKAFMQLSSAVEEQERLAAEKISLEESVKKLKRDVAKLETFKKALMSSLQDEDESPAPMSVEDKQPARQMPLVAPEPERKFTPNLVAISQQDPKTKSPNQSAVPMTPSNLTPGPLTPGLSPSRSPRTHSASNSPTKSRSMSISPTKKKLLKGSSAATSPIKSRPRSTISFSGESTKASNKWHSVNDGAVSLPSSLASSKHTTAPNSPPHKARAARLDGKEFFRQARNRLSYEQFSAFLANIKELNAHQQTREETLKKANDIFGAQNADLYMAFDSLLSRHLPGDN